MKTILIIDDEKEICRSLKGIFNDEGYRSYSAQTAQEAFIKLEECTPHLILLDVWLEKGTWDGMYLLERLKQRYPLLPIIMMSGHGTLELAVRAIKNGAYDFIEKPIEIERLLLSVGNAIESFQLKIQQHTFQGSMETWPIPLDGKMKKIAASESRMLILGEYGMYKKRLARVLHEYSTRQSGPFLSISAYELNEMPESILWGEEENGKLKHMGFLEYAQTGTFLLHHVHLLSDSLQHAFAKMFELGVYYRLGSDKPTPANFRFMATALPNFMEEEGHAKLHRAFYDRITLFPFFIKPLRDKKNDILLWTEELVGEIAVDFGIPAPTISSEAHRVLQGYHWPYNIRQLKMVLERAMMECGEETELKVKHFPSEISRMFSAVDNHIFSFPLQEARAVFEYQYLSTQLASVKGNISQAAQIVGMERSALHRKLKILQEKTKKIQ